MYLLPMYNIQPKIYFCSSLVCETFSSQPTKMSPRASSAVSMPSPLTNNKLLAAFKGQRSNVLKIEDISTLGDRYMQKATSIRYII